MLAIQPGDLITSSSAIELLILFSPGHLKPNVRLVAKTLLHNWCLPPEYYSLCSEIYENRCMYDRSLCKVLHLKFGINHYKMFWGRRDYSELLKTALSDVDVHEGFVRSALS